MISAREHDTGAKTSTNVLWPLPTLLDASPTSIRRTTGSGIGGWRITESSARRLARSSDGSRRGGPFGGWRRATLR